MKIAALGFILVNLLAMCSGPPYDRPDAMLPPVYPEAPAASSPGASLGDLGWWQIFKDPELLKLERTAVARNQNILIAAQRVQQAEAQLTITGSGRYPQINLEAEAPYSKTNGQVPRTSAHSTFTPYGILTLQYEVDLFDKVGSATAAARAQVLESEYAKETVISTVVTSVATFYFQLRELDEELDIARKTLVARKKNLALTRARLKGGIGTLQDVRQAEELVAQVSAAIPQLRSGIVQVANELNILAGGYPGQVTRGLALEDQVELPLVPSAGVPSSLIERRPDIEESEAALIAANAQIGEARALLFPQFAITGSAGAASAQENDIEIRRLLRLSPSVTYAEGLINVIPQIAQQIFNAGAVHAEVGASKANEEAAVLSYLQTIHEDVAEVSDTLVAYREDRATAIAERANAAAAVDSTRLANMRFEGGVTSYTEVLISETQSYQAELDDVQAQYNERAALVQLYKALGGGWQTEPQEKGHP